MKINQKLVVTVISVLASTLVLTLLDRANAEVPFHQIAQATDAPNQPPNEHRRRPRIDFAAAAEKLGVTEAQLKDALGVPANPPNPSERNGRPPRPDFKAAAAKLGVTEQQLIEALGIPPRPPANR
ncbi:hypothetical protein [Scytonema sp. NUACC26]|uniref:hypothetical protein n=1 Tax=Scytonema sp. NUACC26 TaxID=3140176 RepID=UPI0034DBBF6D